MYVPHVPQAAHRAITRLDALIVTMDIILIRLHTYAPKLVKQFAELVTLIHHTAQLATQDTTNILGTAYHAIQAVSLAQTTHIATPAVINTSKIHQTNAK